MMLKTPCLALLFLIAYLHIHGLPPANWIAELNALSNPKVAFINQSSNLLFDHYAGLEGKIPYIKLAALPTPIEKLHEISSALGVQTYIKRDDLSGGFDAQGTPLYGGNKIRKLEFLLAQAQAHGAKNILTFGAAGSNHALATAAHAQRLGMHTICMLKPQAHSTIVQHHLLTHLSYDSELHYSPNDAKRDDAAYALCLEYLANEGQAPYIIPTGGSNTFGILGFVNAALELNEQINQGICPKPTHIYVACGSCATTAGLLLGCKAIGLDIKIIAVAVEPDFEDHFAKTIAQLFKETNQYLHDLDASFPLCTYSQKDLIIDHTFCGADYGEFTPEGTDATKKMLALENIFLDGTYTAKAFAGLLARAPKEQDAVILFWNTYYRPVSSKRTLFPDYHQLPICFHAYFTDL